MLKNRAERRHPFNTDNRVKYQLTVNDVCWNPMFISGQIEDGWEEALLVERDEDYSSVDRWLDFTGVISEDPWLDFAAPWTDAYGVRYSRRSMVIDSYYVEGSDDSRRLSFRLKGTKVYHAQGRYHDYLEPEDVYVVQWGGTYEYDSGYSQRRFKGYQEARQYFEEMRNF